MAGQETPPAQATSPGGSQGRNVLTPPSSLPPVSRQGLLLTKPDQEPEAGPPLVWPLRGRLEGAEGPTQEDIPCSLRMSPPQLSCQRLPRRLGL